MKMVQTRCGPALAAEQPADCQPVQAAAGTSIPAHSIPNQVCVECPCCIVRTATYRLEQDGLPVGTGNARLLPATSKLLMQVVKVAL